MPFLAARLGMRGGMGAVLLSLGIHELAHIIAARLAGVQVMQIQLLPFGGSARMENPYGLPAGRIIPVAIAGPVANLLSAVSCAALAHWGVISIFTASSLIQPNLMLCIFNLLPALPLDGGRILFTLLERPLGERRALNTGILLGRLLAVALLTAAVIGGLRSGSWNLTLVLAAVFIIASERDERLALSRTHAQRLAEQLHSPAEPQLLRIYQLDAQTRVQDALALLKPRERAWLMPMKDGAPCALLDGKALVEYLINGGAPETALEALPGSISFQPASGAPKASDRVSCSKSHRCG